MPTKDTTENPDELLKAMRYDAHYLNREGWAEHIDALVKSGEARRLVDVAIRFAARFQRMDELCRSARLPDGWATADVPTTEGG